MKSTPGIKRMIHSSFFLIILCISSIHADCQITGDSEKCSSVWRLTAADEITWDLPEKVTLQHADNIEMSGRKVSSIVKYGTDSAGKFFVSREVIWPLLRTVKKPDDQEWMAYRAYLRRTFTDSQIPILTINGTLLQLTSVRSVKLNGTLVINHNAGSGLSITRTFLPSSSESFLIEFWKIENKGNETVSLSLSAKPFTENEEGFYGNYIIEVRNDNLTVSRLEPGKSVSFGIYFTARKSEENLSCKFDEELKQRKLFLNEMKNSLQLVTPDPVLNTAFLFSKIRTAESIFQTKRGLMHSPGGGRYYAGVWANDQVEYAGPFFPFLGYKPGIEASLNAYRIFAGDMKPDYSPIWSSHEIEGDLTCCGRDRGDAAMYLYGASRFLLASGDEEEARNLFPSIIWAAEYNRRKTTSDGVIASQTDEMEGRIATGSANLSTSVLCYGGLLSAADLVRSLKENPSLGEQYSSMAASLKRSIDIYFGSDIEGFHTYRYFSGHNKLRHWICLPLTMGIEERKDGTINALFSKLWTENGLLVEEGDNMFWDRGTLYALRGVFNAGATEKGIEKLKEYTCQRLLGNHVPYPVEAWPEGDQAHLAAESALYCRIFTEGLFGIVPTGFKSFSCCPRLPSGWDKMELNHIRAFGEDFNINVSRNKQGQKVTVTNKKRTIYSKSLPPGRVHLIELGILSKEISGGDRLKQQRDFSRYQDIFELIRGEISNVKIVGTNVYSVKTNSFSLSAQVLYVVDGTITDGISYISPVNVKSIEYLQDSAAAEYGMRGANGVIRIVLKN